MNEGPFRMPDPADRGAVNKPEQSHQQSEEPRPVKEEPRTVQRAAASPRFDKDESPIKRLVLPIIAIVVVIVIGIVGWMVLSSPKTAVSAIDSGKYQAVFFTNGQVYFGKLHEFSDEYMKLTDIFYLQSQATETETDSKNPQKTSTTQNNPTLIKLGEEIHGPEDSMIISKDQVLFYENLKSNGKVAESIEKYKHPN